jgi:hypothetical protein
MIRMSVRQSIKQMSAEVAIRDESGFIHPVSEIQRTIQELRKQRNRIAQMPETYRRRDELLNALEVAIATREALIRQAVK